MERKQSYLDDQFVSKYDSIESQWKDYSPREEYIKKYICAFSFKQCQEFALDLILFTNLKSFLNQNCQLALLIWNLLLRKNILFEFY